ncbi:hypothetical protein [Paenibacillus sp. MMO-177]|uniref:hypothetical protein n=1 Tax=Paenibacillus sp. MMO-177 TaxID=3081289 RepID=UPI00301AEB44
MDFYHSWIYQKMLNTEWFLWLIFGSLLALNFLSPIIVWYVIRRNAKNRRSSKQN